MNRQFAAFTLFAFVMIAIAFEAVAQELIVNPSPAQIEEAIRLAGDEKAASRFLQAYVVQSRSGMGTGPLLGYVSTPFSRVVLAARAARKEGKAFASADVTADLVAPELHVIVLAQTAAYDPLPARLETVVITSNAGAGSDARVEPLRMVAARKEDYAFFGLSSGGDPATVAVFPLTAATPGRSIRVTFTTVIRGSSALTNCKECAVPLGANRLR